MDTINAIIVRCQSAHKTSLSTVTRKAVAISLKATMRPCRQTQQERCESIVRALWVSQWQSSRNDNYHHRSINCHDASAANARWRHSTRETSGRLGKFKSQISRNKHVLNNKTYKKELAAKKNEAVVTQTPRVMRKNCWRSCEPSHLAEPVIPSLVTTEQARATTTKTTILLVLNPQLKRMLVVWCSGLATALSSRVQSVKNILDGFSRGVCLDSKLDARILLRCLVTSSSRTSVWFW